ncbi:MAG: 2-phosphosulfolactate phosphatase [Tenuifilaceae bacterium]|jgi:2-phosphosulfolactate phosphatase|nr:2-phosphosulfolactate phosphatase [Tenuifilaceae bacterium]
MDKRKVEVCFSTALFPFHKSPNAHVVVVDILRATSAICTAFANGAKGIIPVATVDEAREYKERGYMVASERDGIKIDFADFGNSPFNFTPDRVQGKEVVYSTTNGTQAITMASAGLSVSIGSFLNLSAVATWLNQQNEGDVLILCAGWKGKFCLEDTLFAGALAEILINEHGFTTVCDSAKASIDLWGVAKPNLYGYVQKVAQWYRLGKLGLDDVIEYCHTPNITSVVPVLQQGMLYPVAIDSV